jgi:outer membrane protein assembly factor BamD
MKKINLFLLLGLLAVGCATQVDTTTMTSEQHFKYAKSLYDDEDYEKAINEFQAILLQFPGSPITDDAEYYLGMSYFKSGQYLLGAYQFSKLIKDIPNSQYVADAQFMLAESYYKLSPPYQLDQTYTKKAIEEFQAFIDFFPTNKKVNEAEKKIKELNDKLAEKEYMSAVIYEKMEYYNAAIIYYKKVIEKFHDTKYAPLAMYHEIKLLAMKHRDAEALQAASEFLAKYPHDPNAKEVLGIQKNLKKEENADISKENG